MSIFHAEATDRDVCYAIHTYIYAVHRNGETRLCCFKTTACMNETSVVLRKCERRWQKAAVEHRQITKTIFFTFCVYRILERKVVPLIHRNYSPLQKQGEKKPQKQAFLLVVFVQHTKLPASAAVCLHKNIYSVLQFIIAEAKSRLQVRSKDTQHQKRIE